MGFKFLTLDRWLETMDVKDLIFLLKEIAEHEEIRNSAKHISALSHAIDLFEHPNPRAWCTSSDSDTLRCPCCLMRVLGGNPWREGNKIKPMNIFCQHGDTIYCWLDSIKCPGCGKWLDVRNLKGEIPREREEVRLVYVGDEESKRIDGNRIKDE